MADHKGRRPDTDIQSDPWAESGTCAVCGGPIVFVRGTPDRYGNQKMTWRHQSKGKS